MSRRYPRGPFDPFEQNPFEGLRDVHLPRPPRRFWIGLGFIGAALVVVFLTAPVVGFITENQWFDALGIGSVYRTRVLLQVLLFFGSLILSLAFGLINVIVALRLRSGASLRALGVRRSTVRTPAGYIALTAVALVALILSSGASSNWDQLALFTHASSTGLREPVFGLDISFYLLQLPFLHSISSWLFTLVFLNLLVAAGLHFWRGETIDLRISGRAMAHLSALLGGLGLVIAFSVFLGRYDLLYAHNGVVFGAGYTDVNARIGLAVAQAVLGVALAAVLFANIVLRRPVLAAGAVAVWIVGSIIVGAYPAAVQRFTVTPSELSQEQPYIKREIGFTRSAYGLGQVQVRDYSGDAPITPDEVAGDSATIDNLRLWDNSQIQETYQQLQSIRTYYTFHQIDLDRYQVGGRLQQVEISARELDQNRLPSQAQNWVNQKLAYTHGYGLAASPVSAVVGEGLPDYVVGDIPPTGSIQITQPQLYFGQVTNGYVLAPSAQAEFDFPKGDQNASNNYTGTHGVKLDGANRALWSLRTGDFNLLISPQITKNTQVLFRRNIQDRISAVAPFLGLYDSPYTVVVNGHIYWVQDAYVTASTYPYSQTVPEDIALPGAGTQANYVRNSVKVVVDAYQGTTDFYISDPTDPIIKAYSATFPSLFRPLSAMPAALRQHLRVPPTQFSVQAELYGTYHIEDPTVLYQREDVWELALPHPYYVLMRLPGEAQAEYLQIIPFEPRGKQNLVAWLAVRNDPAHYGEMVAFTLPKDKVVLGPQQVASRINQTPAFSSDKTLLNQQGSSLIEGNLLAVPIGNSFLYFEPIYLRANSSPGSTSLPELKRVILADATGQSPVAYQPTLQQALSQLIGSEVATPATGSPGTGPTGTPPTTAGNQQQIAGLISQANSLYADAQAALKRGDLATYAQNVQQIGQILQQIKQLDGSGGVAPAPTSAPIAAASPAPRASPSG